MILIHLASAIFGQTLWSTSTLCILGFTVTLTQVLAFLSLATLANAVLSNAAIVLLGVSTPLEKAGVSIARRQEAPKKPLLPLAMLSVLALIAYKLAYFHLNPTMYVLTFAFAYAKLTMKLVVSANLPFIILFLICLFIFRLPIAPNQNWTSLTPVSLCPFSW